MSKPTCGESRPTCGRCGGCGFSGRGTCYADVCDDCAGLGSCGPSCATSCADIPAPAIDGVRAELLGLLVSEVRLRATESGYSRAAVNSLPTIGAQRAAEHPLPGVGPCQEPRYLRCTCGCADLDHDEHDTDGACFNLYCGCTHWRAQERGREEVTYLRTNATCADYCTCPSRCPAVGRFLVTARASDGAWVPLLGPYATHSLALSMVDTGRRMAGAVNAQRYSFGTASWEGAAECPVGRLNERLAEDEARAERFRSGTADEHDYAMHDAIAMTQPRRSRARRST